MKNREGVRINHIDIPMGEMDRNESTYADSSIGEGMDITIQGANGHLRRGEKDRWGGDGGGDDADIDEGDD